MIPIFPQFKKLELSDRKAVETFTSGIPPYSDFNFASMWLWDRKGDTVISDLNGNLVARFSDSRTDESFYSFVGMSECNDTVSELLEYLSYQGLKPELRLVPEVSANELMKEKFLVIEDRDSFDYVLCTKEVSSMDGAKFERLRGKIHVFEKNDFAFVTLDILDKSNQAKLLNCVELWRHARKNYTSARAPGDTDGLEAEDSAFDKLFRSPELLTSLTCYGLFVDSVLAGFVIGEISNDHFLCHFHKTNYKHPGTNEFLFQQTARTLRDTGINYINDEEDLGLQGLRFAKSRYRPVHFLKKYIVRSAR